MASLIGTYSTVQKIDRLPKSIVIPFGAGQNHQIETTASKLSYLAGFLDVSVSNDVTNSIFSFHVYGGLGTYADDRRNIFNLASDDIHNCTLSVISEGVYEATDTNGHVYRFTFPRSKGTSFSLIKTAGPALAPNTNITWSITTFRNAS